MTTPAVRLSLAARCVTIGGVFLGATAIFHFLAASHIPQVLRRTLGADAYAFLEPIVSFTFLLNAVLLMPLTFCTLYCAAGIRRGEPWARWVALASALTVLSLPCLLVSTMGFAYFTAAPLFLAGALSVTVAGLLMAVPLIWAWRDMAR